VPPYGSSIIQTRLVETLTFMSVSRLVRCGVSHPHLKTPGASPAQNCPGSNCTSNLRRAGRRAARPPRAHRIVARALSFFNALLLAPEVPATSTAVPGPMARGVPCGERGVWRPRRDLNPCRGRQRGSCPNRFRGVNTGSRGLHLLCPGGSRSRFWPKWISISSTTVPVRSCP
jgi:hypothetical protein